MQVFKNKKIMMFICMLTVFLLVCPLFVYALDFDEYTQYNQAVVELPPVGDFDGNSSWFTAAECFPRDTQVMIGNYEAAGRILAATGKTIYLQKTYGPTRSDPEHWLKVATVSNNMDPSFIRISPDGAKIALGLGYGQPLLVFPTSLLDPDNPPLLIDANGNPAPGVIVYNVNYYDADWVDNRYLVINGGQWPGPPYGSGVGVLDTSDPNDQGKALITNIPGASSGIAVDADGNLVVGIGYAPGPPNRTGEIKVWNSSEWSTSPNSPLDYEANNRIVAKNVLSPAYLGIDEEGNLHVGAGDAVGTGGAAENGYAALISKTVIDRVADPACPEEPVDESNPEEYREFAPDPCQNDSATGILANWWGENLAVMWNPSSMPPNCNGSPGSASEYWGPGVVPRLTLYYPANPPDYDGDGVPDSIDNAYMTANPGQQDTDGDGYGNACDADFNNDGNVNFVDNAIFGQAWNNYNPSCDLNSDGSINFIDNAMFGSRFGQSQPWY